MLTIESCKIIALVPGGHWELVGVHQETAFLPLSAKLLASWLCFSCSRCRRAKVSHKATERHNEKTDCLHGRCWTHIHNEKQNRFKSKLFRGAGQPQYCCSLRCKIQVVVEPGRVSLAISRQTTKQWWLATKLPCFKFICLLMNLLGNWFYFYKSNSPFSFEKCWLFWKWMLCGRPGRKSCYQCTSRSSL